MRIPRSFFFLLVLLACMSSARSQPAVAPAAAAAPITLSEPALPLNGPWKFHAGDDPRWAGADFDDFGWQDYVLDSAHPAPTPVEALQLNAIPGWQQHGHPGYTGYAWYRIRLRAPQQSGAIALLMPASVDDAYEVYVNGVKMGGFGKLDGWPLAYPGQPELFPLPAAAAGNGRPITLALRFWNLRDEAPPRNSNLAGGLRGMPLMGPSALLHVFELSARQQAWRPPWNMITQMSLYGSVGLISLLLFLLSRQQREYLWTGISLTSFAAMIAGIAVFYIPQTLVPVQVADAVQFLAYGTAAFAMPLAAMYLLGVPRAIWRRANYLVSLVNLVWNLASRESRLVYGLQVQPWAVPGAF